MKGPNLIGRSPWGILNEHSYHCQAFQVAQGQHSRGILDQFESDDTAYQTASNLESYRICFLLRLKYLQPLRLWTGPWTLLTYKHVFAITYNLQSLKTIHIAKQTSVGTIAFILVCIIVKTLSELRILWKVGICQCQTQ